MLGNNFGLIGSRPKQKLDTLARYVRKGGIILAQTRSATKTERDVYKQYHMYNKVRNRPTGCIRLRIRYKHFKTPWLDYLYIDKNELKDLINETDFRIESIYGNSSSSQYTFVLKRV